MKHPNLRADSKSKYRFYIGGLHFRVGMDKRIFMDEYRLVLIRKKYVFPLHHKGGYLNLTLLSSKKF